MWIIKQLNKDYNCAVNFKVKEKTNFKMVINFKVFKKSSPNGKVNLYMGKRDFVDHISAVEPIGN